MIVNIKIWDRNVGYVAWDKKMELATFQYDSKFLSSKLDIAPIVMPLKKSSEDRVNCC